MPAHRLVDSAMDGPRGGKFDDSAAPFKILMSFAAKSTRPHINPRLCLEIKSGTPQSITTTFNTRGIGASALSITFEMKIIRPNDGNDSLLPNQNDDD